jgi:hypothetical protein
VRDEEIGQPVTGLKPIEQIKQTPLFDRVERGQGFIQDHEPRFEDEGPRYVDALALPRAHADRQAASVVVGKTDLRHDLASPFGDRACIFSMNREANADAFSHGHMRGDAIERVLQDELKSAPHPEPFAIRHGADVLTLEQDVAAVRRLDPRQETRKRRLSSAGLADEAEIVAGEHVEAHAAHRLNMLIGEEALAGLDLVGSG